MKVQRFLHGFEDLSSSQRSCREALALPCLSLGRCHDQSGSSTVMKDGRPRYLPCLLDGVTDGIQIISVLNGNQLEIQSTLVRFCTFLCKCNIRSFTLDATSARIIKYNRSFCPVQIYLPVKELLQEMPSISCSTSPPSTHRWWYNGPTTGYPSLFGVQAARWDSVAKPCRTAMPMPPAPRGPVGLNAYCMAQATGYVPSSENPS